MSDQATLRAVIFKDGDQWIAQALECDICAQGPDLDTLRERFLDTLSAEQQLAHEAGVDLVADIGPAPAHFFSMWDERSQFSKSIKMKGDNAKLELALCA